MDERQSTRGKDDWARTFDAVPDLILILTTSTAWRANKAMAQRMGCSPEDLIGQSCHQVVHDSHTPPRFCPHRNYWPAATSMRWRFTTSDWRHVPGPVSPIRPGDTIMGSVHVARDITEQKGRAWRLKQSANAINS
jgi:PAS domain S-box-containing protein